MEKSETSNVRRETQEAKECGLMGEYGGGMEDALSSGGKAEEQLLAGLDSITNYELSRERDKLLTNEKPALVLDADDAALLDGFVQTRWDKANLEDGGFEVLPVVDVDAFAVFDEYPPFEKGVLQAMYDYLRTDCQLDTAKAFMMALNLGKAVFTIKRVVK